MVGEYIQFLEEQFKARRVEADALPMAKYMKNKFEFYGVKSQLRKSINKEARDRFQLSSFEEVEQLVNQLWAKPYRELQYTAIDILVRKKKVLAKKDIPWIESLIETKSWWDTVDGLAPNVAGYLFFNDRTLLRKYVLRWRKDASIWLQRSSLICQLRFKDEVDADLLFETIDFLSGSDEFFVNKAAGWSLRQYSKFDPQKVHEFIASRNLHPLIRREGSKYLQM
jgi:3-methyladenine DNA glycosylase AlkD